MTAISEEARSLLIIIRGLPGSGKSTLARELCAGGVVYSTDDYFHRNGSYNFNAAKLPEAHAWNKRRAIKAMQNGISPVVIDNTNILAWEAKPYAQAALEHGYAIEIHEPDTPWRFDAAELAQCNTHGVPLGIIQDMLEKWEPLTQFEAALKTTE